MRRLPMHLALLFLLASGLTVAQNALTPDILKDLRSSFVKDASTKVMMNAVSVNSAKILALDRETSLGANQYFSHKIKTEGITDQKSSGRWTSDP